jgi:hypothetical protein
MLEIGKCVHHQQRIFVPLFCYAEKGKKWRNRPEIDDIYGISKFWQFPRGFKKVESSDYIKYLILIGLNRRSEIGGSDENPRNFFTSFCFSQNDCSCRLFTSNLDMHSEMASSNVLEDIELYPHEPTDSLPTPTQSRRENFFRAIDAFKSREPTPPKHDGPTPGEGDTSPLNRSLKG